MLMIEKKNGERKVNVVLNCERILIEISVLVSQTDLWNACGEREADVIEREQKMYLKTKTLNVQEEREKVSFEKKMNKN
jgi:hypothetical protein